MKSIKKQFVILLALSIAIILIQACQSNEPSTAQNEKKNSDMSQYYDDKQNEEKKSTDELKGIGKFTNVEVSATLDKKMADAGKAIYDVKCSACHKLTEEKLVGPGWKGVTNKRTAEWILNFSTNPDEMLDKDAIAKGLLEECLVRMPNQGLSDDDARHVYEFMRSNDGIK
jgi:mono/diheme cytochrome c family protein